MNKFNEIESKLRIEGNSKFYFIDKLTAMLFKIMSKQEIKYGTEKRKSIYNWAYSEVGRIRTKPVISDDSMLKSYSLLYFDNIEYVLRKKTKDCKDADLFGRPFIGEHWEATVSSKWSLVKLSLSMLFLNLDDGVKIVGLCQDKIILESNFEKEDLLQRCREILEFNKDIPVELLEVLRIK